MWWRFFYFYENLFCFTKKVLPILILQAFFDIFLPQPPVWCFQLIFIIQCAVFKNIFACLFSAHNTRSLSSHEQVRLIRLRFEILRPSFTKKAWKCVHLSMCSDPKNFLEVAKGIERLQQNALVKLRFSNSDRASLLIESFLLKLNTITSCFEHDILTNIAGCYQNRNPSQIF